MEDQPFEKKTRAICCTKNNWTAKDVEDLVQFASEKCTYLVYGEETGTLCGTPHLQIYFELKDAMSYTACNKKLFNAWYKKRGGTPKQAAGYCKKGDEQATDYAWFYDHPAPSWIGQEFGQLSQQGKRTDIDDVVEMIVHEKCPMRAVALAHPAQYVKYNRGLTALRSIIMEPRCLAKAPEVIVLWGATGTGKTRDALTKYWPEVPHYKWKSSNGQWWDGYDGEKKIIIEEFRGTMIWADLLDLLDRNECRVPVKGGFVQIQADKFVICSPKPPAAWYKDDDEYDKIGQLRRRITTIVHQKKRIFEELPV